MINVLQKVTTFPLEMIEFPQIDDKLVDYSNNAIHDYYTNPAIDGDKKPLTDEDIKGLKALSDEQKKQWVEEPSEN